MCLICFASNRLFHSPNKRVDPRCVRCCWCCCCCFSNGISFRKRKLFVNCRVVSKWLSVFVIFYAKEWVKESMLRVGRGNRLKFTAFHLVIRMFVRVCVGVCCAHVNYTQILHHIASISVDIFIFLFINFTSNFSKTQFEWIAQSYPVQRVLRRVYYALFYCSLNSLHEHQYRCQVGKTGVWCQLRCVVAVKSESEHQKTSKWKKFEIVSIAFFCDVHFYRAHRSISITNVFKCIFHIAQ